jgi:hypothetical protein
MGELAREVARVSPTGKEDRPAEDVLVESIGATSGLASDFVKVAEEIARRNDKDAALRLFHGFEALLQQYARPPGTAGVFSAAQFQLPRFLGHELFTSFVALLLKHERFDLLGEVLREALVVETDDGYARRSFSRLSAQVGLLRTYFERRGTNYISPAAAILKDRHTGESALARAVPWRRFIEADYLLFLRAAFDLPAQASAYWNEGWAPWSYPFLEEVGTPAWLARAESLRDLGVLCRTFGLESADEFRRKYAVHANEAGKLFPEGFSLGVRLPKPDKLGSRP